ncbi:EAL domain-containing protein, partial [Klebsiella pneumoniae]
PGSLYHHHDAVGWLMDSLLAAGLRPDQVLIEVTETEVITCFDQFRKVLKALRVAGMKLAIDDFGAGYSGLSLLTRFQPDKIKVDAELVRDIRLFQGFLFSRPCLNGIGEICWPVARQAMDL